MPAEELDDATVQILRETFGDEALLPIVETFLTDGRRLVDVMLVDAQKGVAPSVAASCHQLKSSSATIGANALSAECAALERSIKTGAPVDVTAQVAAIHERFARVAREVEALAAKLRG